MVLLLAIVPLASAQTEATCTSAESTAYNTHCDPIMGTFSNSPATQDIVCDATTDCGTAMAAMRTNCPVTFAAIISNVDGICNCRTVLNDYNTACSFLSQNSGSTSPVQMISTCASAGTCNQAITALMARNDCNSQYASSLSGIISSCSWAQDSCTLAAYSMSAHCPVGNDGMTAATAPSFCGTSDCGTAVTSAAQSCTAPTAVGTSFEVTQSMIDNIQSTSSMCTTYRTCTSGGGTATACYDEMMGGGFPIVIIIIVGAVVAVVAIVTAVVVYLKSSKSKGAKKDTAITDTVPVQA